jgi:hypothetical protein
LMYVLPRSGVLVSMEPKIIQPVAPAAPKAKTPVEIDPALAGNH